MDAKSRANFINSVAGGQKIPCPNCNALNSDDAFFCTSCGTKLIKPAGKVQEPVETTPVTPQPTKASQKNAFAPIRKPSGGARPVQPSAPAEKPASQGAPSPRPSGSPASALKKVDHPEPVTGEVKSVFAQGLPSWDVVPPQVVVRRKKK